MSVIISEFDRHLLSYYSFKYKELTDIKVYLSNNGEVKIYDSVKWL